MEDDRKVPAPREYGCPACMSGEHLYFESLDRGRKSEVKCDKDGWRGQINSAEYEQYFFRLAKRKSRNGAIVLTVIGIIFIASIFFLAQVLSPEPHITLKIRSDHYNWTVTVNTIQNADRLIITDVYVEIHSPNNLTLLPGTSLLNLSSGEYYRGVNFTNRFPYDYLTINESFAIDKSMYPNGCKFLLTSQNSTAIYCNYDLKTW